MQPVRIGMNSALVLIILLLAVPLQLFLSHYINSIYAAGTTADSAVSGKGGKEAPRTIETVRREALDRLSVGLTEVADYVQGTIQHYSKLRSWKDLLLVSYTKELQHRKKKRKTGGFTLERTLTVDKLGKTETSGSDSLSSSSPPDSKTDKAAAGYKDEVKADKPADKMEKVVKDEKYMFKNVYFARSTTPRINRPEHVTLRVGDVVKHKEQGYYGVIVGWDERAMAPKKWLDTYYAKRSHLKDEPNYLVLVDSHYDASGTPFHYLPQEHLELVQDEKIQVRAPEISHYFENYKDNRHIPRPWLKEIYPED